MTAPMTRSWYAQYRDEPRTPPFGFPRGEPEPICRCCFEPVPSSDFGTYDEAGAICTACCELLDGSEAS